jgi:putative protease
MKRPELLAPAGDLERAKIALMYGADAVYVGGKEFSLRARASNFTLENIKDLVEFAHGLGKKVYLTTNIVPHDEDLVHLEEYLKSLEDLGVDAVIASSLHIVKTALKVAPKLEVHLSTQASTANSASIAFWKELGVRRVVLAREVPIREMELIARKTDVELEVFIHGGMCVSYSGRCMLSNHMTNRDANRGGCAHSCRWNYTLYESKKKVDDQIFNMGSKDLMALEEVPELINLGIASFKIEGRMKSAYYLATVVRTYRMLIDEYLEKGAVTEDELKGYAEEIAKAENRETGSGFLKGKPGIDIQLYDTRTEHPTKEYIGYVLDYNMETKEALIEQRNYFEVGDKVEFFGPSLSNTYWTVDAMEDADTGEVLTVARHPMQRLKMKIPFKISAHDMMRKVMS